MSRFVTFLVLLSAALFVLIAAYSWLRTHRHSLFAAELAGVALVLGVLDRLFDFSSPIVSFGPGDRILILLAFMSMLAGIGAQYFFDLWNRPKPRRRFDLPSFLKAFLISPIVFLPVLGLIPDELKEFSRREVFVCLNAFQNGFFWRVVYDKVESQLRS
jgi:hypothetical protein